MSESTSTDPAGDAGSEVEPPTRHGAPVTDS
ncbi:MAG: hypothetical protein QOD72_979, partial [Acidimicrobiaceae bacterium]|nr:hypothetical protein [Acidimicrobiaceae bacterium]